MLGLNSVTAGSAKPEASANQVFKYASMLGLNSVTTGSAKPEASANQVFKYASMLGLNSVTTGSAKPEASANLRICKSENGYLNGALCCSRGPCACRRESGVAQGVAALELHPAYLHA